MRHLVPALIVVLLLLAPGCGGDDPASDDAGLDFGNMQDPEDFWKQAGEVELTDEMMEEFFTIAEELKAAGSDQARAMLVWSKYKGWDMLRWSQIAAKFGMASVSVAYAESEDDIREGMARFEEQIEKQRKRLESATAEERAEIEQSIARMEQAYEVQQKQLNTILPGAKKSADKNRAILEKWRKRWDELDWKN